MRAMDELHKFSLRLCAGAAIVCLSLLVAAAVLGTGCATTRAVDGTTVTTVDVVALQSLVSVAETGFQLWLTYQQSQQGLDQAAFERERQARLERLEQLRALLQTALAALPRETTQSTFVRAGELARQVVE